jgi:hypothetical protein
MRTSTLKGRTHSALLKTHFVRGYFFADAKIPLHPNIVSVLVENNRLARQRIPRPFALPLGAVICAGGLVYYFYPSMKGYDLQASCPNALSALTFYLWKKESS